MTNQHPEPVGSLEGSDVQTVGLTRAEKTLTTKGEELIELIAELRSDGWSVADRAADALQALIGERDGWKTIDSAPKDGTDVLLFYSAASRASKVSPGLLNPYTAPIEIGRWFGGRWSGQDCEPTHWQPLPTLPVDVSGDREGADANAVIEDLSIATSGGLAESGGPTRAAESAKP